MPLVGGGGAGNVAGSNPSGTGGSLVFAGNNYWAGWSGWLDVASGSPATLFDFTSPNRIAIKVKFYYSFDYDVIAADQFWGTEISLNGEDILKPKAENVSTGEMAGMPLENKVEFIIMPQTRVIIKAVSGGDTQAGGTLIAQGLYE